ncbi:hypothetical protein [Agromyces sp. NPDC049794]|uniref:hypothetical protein n=1 Tax=unclassified Agromyces TaxID=2639701 RepID=UPI0033CFD874
MSETVTITTTVLAGTPAAPTTSADPADVRRARASIAFGRKRGYYRVLFEAGPVDPATFAELADVPLQRAQVWLDEQLAAGVLRVVTAPSGDHEELLLPGEYVPILLGDVVGDDDHELDGARALLAELHGELPSAFDAGLEHERRRVFADHARMTRMV